MGEALGLNDGWIVIGSAILAALSFILFALPFLNRQDQKENYRNVIEKKRKALFDQTVQGVAARAAGDRTVSAKESLASVYRVQNIIWEDGPKIT
jgi:hypothetical protein